MTKQPTNLRLSAESREACDRLEAMHAYKNRTDAVEGATACWEQALSLASVEVAGMFTREEWGTAKTKGGKRG